MVFMTKRVQKNFSLPKALAANWDKFQAKGSKESSANASGALFLYMLMPATVREAARSVSHESDLNAARKLFWEKLGAVSQDALLAKALLDTVQAREAENNKKKSDIVAKSG